MERKHKLLLIIVIATILGFASGIVGEIIARVYILREAFNVPLFGEIDYLNDINGSNLVIRNPKKVVVEQNIKAKETIDIAGKSIVSIYKTSDIKPAKDAVSATSSFDIDSFIQLDKAIAQGIVITSDGWLVSTFLPEDFPVSTNGNNDEKLKKYYSQYKIITSNREVLKIDNIIIDEQQSYSYWHVNANDLSIKQFINDQEISNGEAVLVVNREKAGLLSSIVKQSKGRAEKLVNSSDEYINVLILENNVEEMFYGSFIFNLSGDLVGIINNHGEAHSIGSLLACINCLLKNRTIERPSLGVYYIHLSDLVDPENNLYYKGALVAKNEKGIAVKKGSPAEASDLTEGDIITSIDNKEIGENFYLNQVINQYIPEDEIDVVFLRNNQRKSIKIKLGSL